MKLIFKVHSTKVNPLGKLSIFFWKSVLTNYIS